MKMYKISLSILLVLSSIFSFAHNVEATEYKCFENEGVIKTCSGQELIGAFHFLKNHVKRNQPLDLRKVGGVMFTVGAATVAIGYYVEEYYLVDGILTDAAKGFLPRVFGSFFGGVGALLLLVDAMETADGTNTGFLASDKGISQLLSLSDEDLLSYSRMDSRVSLRVMKIYSALTEIELIQRK
jgi:hypothetical protein